MFVFMSSDLGFVTGSKSESRAALNAAKSDVCEMSCTVPGMSSKSGSPYLANSEMGEEGRRQPGREEEVLGCV